ncbi:MAG: FAD-dependent oxidoreductase [Brevibacterium yomogidense]|uniref:FAD-dependent oxidoreductase n=1 Tax=Brevibacterium sp. Mu109 TaxID=1255669 RepID=UPI000C5EA214|nr:FAD-dependent oxidoreductase [Brevibacterium sp. Mu109]SMX65772.1 Glycine cleavage system T protein (aminomethyltransferase) [Brevibacterium sp. Mu109]
MTGTVPRTIASSAATTLPDRVSARPPGAIDPSSRIVIIGAGVVGAALADELVTRGCTRVTVLDQGPLPVTGGSSSHAPGFVFQVNGSRVMCGLAQRTLAKLDGLEVDGRRVLDRIGGLEVATTEGQLAELRRRYGYALAWGVPAELIEPARVAELWPGLDTSQIIGALHTPTDGIVHSKRAVEHQLARAEEGGAEAIGLTRVVDVETENGRVTGVVVEDATVPTGGAGAEAAEVPAGGTSAAVDSTSPSRRTIPADVVVATGGIWGHLLGELGGLRLPMHPMEHGYAWTAPVPDLPGTAPDGSPLGDDQAGRPMIRHQGAGLYMREFGTRIGIGAYEHRPIPLAPEDLTDTAHMLASGQEPAKRAFTREDFEFCRAEAARLLPAIADLPLEGEFNGVFSFTPDGGPMLGPSLRLDGFWAAQAIWVTASAGCAEVLADWMLTGDPGVATQELDAARFDPALLSDQWIRERAAEAYDEVYDVSFPHQGTVVTRGLKTSPFHTRIQDAGGYFDEANGWERALWHGENAKLFSDPEFRTRAVKAFGAAAAATTALEDPAVPGGVAEGGGDTVPVVVPRRDAWDQVNWSPIAAAEAWATRNRVAAYDMTSLTRYRVRGAGATAWLERLNTNKVGKLPGAVTYSLMLDETGGILSDVTVTSLGGEEYMIGANGPLDLDRLTRLLPESGTVVLDDITTSTCCVGLWGPRARDVLEPITEGDISHEGLRYFRAARIRVAGVPVLALRVSYVGELGWELYTEAAHGLRLWDALMDAGAPHGIVPGGRAAFSSLRLEKGYRAWGSDMTREDTPEDAGLGFAVRMEKDGGFIGRDALVRQPSRGRRLAAFGMRMDAGRPEAGSPVFAGTEVVGWVTSADFGYVTGQVIGLAWVAEERAEPGTPLEIMRFGRVHGAEVLAEPVYDAGMSRIRR